MKTKILTGLILLIAVIGINSCENEQASPPSSLIVLSSSCDTTDLTYSSGSNTMQAIINVQCGVTTGTTSCHSQTGVSGIPYTSYSGIYAQYTNGNLYSVLFSASPNGGQRMPLQQQSGWDPSCMLPKFKAWIDRGCPQ
jgi:hypothetical protein